MVNMVSSAFGLLLALLSCVFADFRQDALNSHNEYRAGHGSPALSLHNDLNNFAQNYAQKLADSGKFEHSGEKYGENLYMTSGGSGESDSRIAVAAVRAWYNEEPKYNYDEPGFSMETGHFTAVVWKDTKFLGIGVARNGEKVYVVGSYDPAGNVGGRYPENVPRPNSNSESDNCAFSNIADWITEEEKIPNGFSPVLGGVDLDGQIIHVCTTSQSGDMIPGKLVRGHCFVGYGGAEHKHTRYRYLISRKVNHCPSVKWVNTQSSLSNSIPGGKTQNGELLYVVRCQLSVDGKNVHAPGKLHANNKERAFYGFGGQERTCDNYAMLKFTRD